MWTLITNVLNLFLEAAPWLVLGLVLAGGIRASVSVRTIERLLGGGGIWPITKAALVGAPLPLCSCGVVPAALSLRRAGASRGSTLSFLISTPETGADSIAVTYAMMGPFMAVLRPVSAVVSAISVGLAASVLDTRAGSGAPRQPASVPDAPACCGPSREETACCDSTQQPAAEQTPALQLLEGLRYAFTDIFDEIVWWMALGLLAAGIVMTLVPETALAGLGSGLLAKIAVLLVGVPMYICATASTPLAASLLLAGMSPGTVLVFLLAGPATNIATLGIVRREFGNRTFLIYLIGMAVASIALGIATDHVVTDRDIDVLDQVREGGDLIPAWVQAGSAILLSLLAVRPLRTRVLAAFEDRSASPGSPS